MNKINDQDLVKRIKGDDIKKRDEAFLFLYQEYYPMVLKFIEQNKGTASDAKDIFQDGLIVLHNQVRKNAFQARSTIKTYLYSICRNLWLKKINRNKSTFDLIDNQKYIETEANALESLIGTEREQCVEEVLRKMGKECQSILKFFYYDKFSMKKIQEHLNLASEQVAKNKKSKCLKKLRKLVLEHPFYSSILKK